MVNDLLLVIRASQGVARNILRCWLEVGGLVVGNSHRLGLLRLQILGSLLQLLGLRYILHVIRRDLLLLLILLVCHC